MSTMSGNVLQPIKNLQTSLNNEIAARGNGDSNLQNQISSLQSQIGQGQAVCYKFSYIVGSSGVYVTLPAGGTWMVWLPSWVGGGFEWNGDAGWETPGHWEYNSAPGTAAGGTTIHVYENHKHFNSADADSFDLSVWAIRASVYRL